ncbi:hypothetical protein GCWU000341_02653 [Oribacterium sp. oral taxon 078 str. F0262]|nr:hypothetical protein GCWU000341_02653 [Oribacterium sp. oral taxon 078 str. F0262]
MKALLFSILPPKDPGRFAFVFCHSSPLPGAFRNQRYRRSSECPFILYFPSCSLCSIFVSILIIDICLFM